MAMEERLSPSFDWIKNGRRKSFFGDLWMHRNVLFDSKLGLPPMSFFRSNYIWFWSLGSQESNVVNGSWFGVETREIWSFEVKLRRVAYMSNSFCLIKLIFWATRWAWKLLNCGSYTGASFGKFWCQILVSSWRQLALVHNWKVVKNIPWPWDLFLNFLFLFLCILLYCMWWEVLSK